jgi:hypothetical protein
MFYAFLMNKCLGQKYNGEDNHLLAMCREPKGKREKVWEKKMSYVWRVIIIN